ncbi:hypothetical protein OHD62_31870 [Mesorhizobium sp. YC-39]|uniref:hypothetical protein n=1 Tax=unclassified Mesorhizobium TaxID=325217 RepID=UPI0021E8A429|nr:MULTISPECIES: hypothetical protein [unclassified Mesorhizobium]MCV3211324.1 hypothetical protein [Mesorhizobium sp. YC-2]MCV3232988.1 hypothetical protein [Mesorhizobium sp. YC-39]
MWKMLRSALAVIFAMALPLASAAEEIPLDPNELSVQDASGKNIAVFSVKQLQAEFPQQTYDTRTPWTSDGEKIEYRGPLLINVLAKAGITAAQEVKVVAYDNFVSDIRMDEIRSYNPILAVERRCNAKDKAGSLCPPGQDFRPISMVEKGPIFIVWPFDQLPASYVPGRNSIWVFFPVILRAAR